MTTMNGALPENSFETAMEALYSPLHQSVTRQAIQAAAARRTRTVSDMRTYLGRIGLSKPENVIIVHVTGTKGKGSTCCMAETILRKQYGLQTALFTSPHLTDIRERIRIGGRPVSQRVFGQAYWYVRQQLEETAGLDPESDLPVLPGYFRMLSLVATYIFVHYTPKVDVWILEVGMGGRYDATNCWDILDDHTVCGVTCLDLDHTRVLGSTLEQIAWEKGGIFQVEKGSNNVTQRPDDSDDINNVKADSQVQEIHTLNDKTPRFFALHDEYPESVRDVLKSCAGIEGQGGKLHWVGDKADEIQLPDDLVIGLPGKHQRRNAQLAVVLCQAATKLISVNDKGVTVLHQALRTASWPGRGQTVTVPGGNIHFRLDGAHTSKSLQAGWEWFQSVSANETSSAREATSRVLVFNCSHERNPVELLSLLLQDTNSRFDRVYFCRADSERPSAVAKPTADELLRLAGKTVSPAADDTTGTTGTTSSTVPAPTWQDTLATIYVHLEREARLEPCTIASNLNAAEMMKQLQETNTKGKRIEVFVTGSLYLVGSVLAAVQWREPEAPGSLLDSC